MHCIGGLYCLATQKQQHASTAQPNMTAVWSPCYQDIVTVIEIDIDNGKLL